MMRNIFFLVLIFLCKNLNAQTRFEFIYPHLVFDIGTTMIDAVEDSAGNYYFAGREASTLDALIFKLDNNGNMLKNILFGPPLDTVAGPSSYFTKLLWLPDGNLLALGVGTPLPNPDDNDQLWLVKFNKDLEILWSKKYGRSDTREAINYAYLDEAKGIIIASGYTVYSSTFAFSGTMWKFSLDGDSLYTHYFNPSFLYPSPGFVTNIFQLKGYDGYYCTGAGQSGVNEGVILKLDTLLNIDTIIDPFPQFSGYALIPHSFTDSSFIFAMNYSWIGITTPEILVGEWTTGNNLSYSIYTNDSAEEVVDWNPTLPSNNLDFIDKSSIYIGATYYLNTFDAYPYLLKIDSNRNEQWHRYYDWNTVAGINNIDRGTIEVTLAARDGGIILVGQLYSDTEGTFTFVVKVDSSGNPPTSINTELQLSKWEYLLYPNPASHTITLKMPNSESGTVQLYDGTGRLLLTKKFSRNTTVNISSLAPGIYFYTLQDQEGRVGRGKVVKE